MEIKITVKVGDNEPIEVKVDVPVGDVSEDENTQSITPVSKFAVFFDETSPAWHKCAEISKLFLTQQQEAANFRLKKRGYLFLNDVYDMLDIPRTRIGQVVGWVYDGENHRGYADFGIYDDRNASFLSGKTNIALLDFNVDGDILKYL